MSGSMPRLVEHHVLHAQLLGVDQIRPRRTRRRTPPAAAARGLNMAPQHRQAALSAGLPDSTTTSSTTPVLRLGLASVCGSNRLTTFSLAGRDIAPPRRSRQAPASVHQLRSVRRVGDRVRHQAQPRRAPSLLLAAWQHGSGRAPNLAGARAPPAAAASCRMRSTRLSDDVRSRCTHLRELLQQHAVDRCTVTFAIDRPVRMGGIEQVSCSMHEHRTALSPGRPQQVMEQSSHAEARSSSDGHLGRLAGLHGAS